MIPLYEIRLLEDWLRDRAPPWFQDAPVGPEIEAYGALADEHLEYVATALRARYAELAPEDGLNLLGAERNLVRYPAEGLEAFRQRIIDAWGFWQWAGTEYGMGLALAQLGYTSAIVPVRNYDSVRWSEFDVYLYPSTRSYDGSPEERNRILAIINQIKPAHTRISSVRYVPTGPLNWNPAGLTWNPPGQVWGAPPVVLYP
ncbi:phage tail protein [Meiothermus cerbereus]|uniref:phage tail protein n=1 Tax=Meiothermus cerbereus TaxID=65552 RepID=UPI003EEB3736